MIDISYALSGSLKTQLIAIDRLRKDIVSVPLSIRHETELRWNAMVDRIYYSQILANERMVKSHIASVIRSEKNKSMKNDLARYKRAHDTIVFDWMMSPRKISTGTVHQIHDSALGGRFAGVDTTIRFVSDYLQNGNDHPAVQAAIVQLFFEKDARVHRVVARLSTYLFLYKYGYDFRRMFVLEEMLHRQASHLSVARDRLTKNGNLTLWLECYAEGMVEQLKKVKKNLTKTGSSRLVEYSYWNLSDRQKEILGMMEEPGSRITNQKLQKSFRISAVTASRDLSKLSSLGLVFQHGKGRSVYYSRL